MDPRLVRKRERQAKVRLHWEKGLFMPIDIARLLDCSPSTVSKDMHEMGLPVPTKQEITKKRREEVKVLLEEGVSPPEIAKRLRVATTTINGDVRSLGLPKRSRHSRGHQSQGTVVEDVMSMLRAATSTLEQYDFEAINGRDGYVADHETLKRWRRDINAFNKQMRRVQTMIIETQKEQMR